ncbi:MFS transporter, partial [Actinocorallia lasiicapitis]
MTITPGPAQAPAATESAPAAAYAPFGRTTAVLGFTALIATGQLYGVIPQLDAMARDWRTGPHALTWLVTLFGLGYAAGFLLFGPLSDRLGRRRVIVAGVAATVVTTVLAGLAPNAESAFVLRFLQGLTIGAFPPVAFAYIAERIEPRRRLVTATAMTTGFLSSAVVGQLAAQGAVASAGWRWFFHGSALLFAVAAVLLARVLADTPPVGGSP